ncbi:hypothetical protein D9Q98_001339 [Chlorella vulgaris]|uniref:phosphoserine phosphatase n=1 Tax=Chlorella vulgaris TaxID=3077 RepID=A0A9D4Z2J4_CHLVU|nr:hypothetical protein D9Q98_001339 [Chlorella vulgaris]
MVAASSASLAKAEAAGVKLDASPEIIQLLRKADAVTFDVDSTFCCDESIDEIAAFLGVGEQVAALTAQAMGGTVTFQEALAARLGAMQPSQDDMRRFLEQHPPQISPGIPELVAELRAQGKEVFLVSGGFRAVIHPIAEMLNIPVSHVFANTILYNADGSYAGFDPAEFPSRSGGKAEAVKHIKKTRNYQTVIMVGDGITDYEARAPGGADAFIGYGGVVFRENVARLSDWYVFSIPAITATLRASGSSPTA